MPNVEYSDGDMHEILKRAAAIEGNANTSRFILEQSASELGISQQALEQAEAEFQKERAGLAEKEEFMRTLRVEFGQHVVTYITVNLFLIGVWWITSRGYPWFIWPIMGWGIAIVGHWFWARSAAGPEFERELEKWRDRRAKS